MWLTATNPAAAYFVTTTRAWEFAAGGLLALAGDRRPAHGRALAWLGLAAIGLAAARYSPSTAFPGIAAALPVAGTLAVIWARVPVLSFPSLLFLGDISYSVYLWHWPLRTLAPYATGRPVDTTTTLMVLMLTLLLAWLSTRFIEDPVRRLQQRSALDVRLRWWCDRGAAGDRGVRQRAVARRRPDGRARLAAPGRLQAGVLRCRGPRPRCGGARTRGCG